MVEKILRAFTLHTHTHTHSEGPDVLILSNTQGEHHTNSIKILSDNGRERNISQFTLLCASINIKQRLQEKKATDQ